jgi:hypothetical protein
MPASVLPRLPARGIDTRRATRKAFAAVGRRARGAVAVTREEVWFPRRTRLHLAYKFRLRRRRPAGEWIVYVDAVTGAILWKYDNLALGTGRAIVFDPNPVVALGDWRPLLDKDAPIRRVPLGRTGMHVSQASPAPASSTASVSPRPQHETASCAATAISAVSAMSSGSRR